MVPGLPSVIPGVLDVAGHVLPVVDLRRRFGLPLRPYGVSAHLLVVRSSLRTLALVTDEVLGVCEMAAHSVTRTATVFPSLERLSGIATHPDGLLLVCDVEALIGSDEEQVLSDALRELP